MSSIESKGQIPAEELERIKEDSKQWAWKHTHAKVNRSITEFEMLSYQMGAEAEYLRAHTWTYEQAKESGLPCGPVQESPLSEPLKRIGMEELWREFAQKEGENVIMFKGPFNVVMVRIWAAIEAEVKVRAHSSQRSGQLRWVKASERQPKKAGIYYIEYFPSIGDSVKGTAVFQTHSKEPAMYFNSNFLRPNSYQWLDESPLQPIKEPVVEKEKKDSRIKTLQEVVDWIDKDVADHAKEFPDGGNLFVQGAMTALKNLKYFIDLPSPPSIQQEAIPDQPSNGGGERDHGVCDRCGSPINKYFDCKCTEAFPSPEQPEGEIPEEIEKWISDWLFEIVSGPDDLEMHNAKVVWSRGMAIALYRHLQSELSALREECEIKEHQINDLRAELIPLRAERKKSLLNTIVNP